MPIFSFNSLNTRSLMLLSYLLLSHSPISTTLGNYLNYFKLFDYIFSNLSTKKSAFERYSSVRCFTTLAIWFAEPAVLDYWLKSCPKFEIVAYDPRVTVILSKVLSISFLFWSFLSAYTSIKSWMYVLACILAYFSERHLKTSPTSCTNILINCLLGSEIRLRSTPKKSCITLLVIFAFEFYFSRWLK